MTFKKWYEETYKEKWHPDYATFDAWKWMTEYEKYCESNNIKPIWNG